MRYVILILALAVCAPAPAATLAVYKDGFKDVTVPAGQYINVFSVGTAKVSKRPVFPDRPESFAKETNGDVENEETAFGPYSAGAVVRIEAGADGALYSVGTGGAIVAVSRPSPALTPPSGSIVRVVGLASQKLTPTTKNTTATLTAAELLTGEIQVTHTTGATLNHTLPTGTLMDAAVKMEVGDAFEWSLINLSAAALDTVTLNAGTDHTIVAVAVVPSAHSSTGGTTGTNSARFRTRKTAANTFVTTRI